MIIRKIITVLNIFFLTIKNVEVKQNIHSNIERRVCIYNHGKSLKIGEGVYIRTNVNINTEENGKLGIGNKVFINRNSIISCREKITINNGCIIGPNVCIYDHDHIFGENGVEKGYSVKEVIIEENCWLGAGVIVLKGTHIGKNSIVGAGTVLKGNYPDNSIIYNKKEVIVKKMVSKN